MKYFVLHLNAARVIHQLRWVFMVLLLVSLGIVVTAQQHQPRTFPCAASGINIEDCEALVALYNTTDGDSWKAGPGLNIELNWLEPGTNPCSWYGVICNSAVATNNFNDCEFYSGSPLEDAIGEERVHALCLEDKNLLGTLPDNLDNLTELKILWIGLNPQLGGLEKIGQLLNLRILGIRGLQLLYVPSIWGATNLVDIDLGSNRLIALPAEIGTLSNLKGLKLINNELTKLPEEIGQLSNLTFLGVSENALKSLPNSMGNLTNLDGLNLAGNNLSSLPATMSNLTGLQNLILDRNSFTAMPEALQGMTGLTGFTIIANGINTLPEWLPTVGTQPPNPLGEGSDERLSDFPSAVSINVIDGNAINPDQLSPTLLAFLDRPYVGGVPYDWRSSQYSAPTMLQAEVTQQSQDALGKVKFTWEPIAIANHIGFYEIGCSEDGTQPFVDETPYVATTLDLATSTLTMRGLSIGEYDCAIRTHGGPYLRVTSFRFHSNPSAAIDISVTGSDFEIPNDDLAEATRIIKNKFEYFLGDFGRANINDNVLPDPSCADVTGLKSVYFKIQPTTTNILRGPGQFVFSPHSFEVGGAGDLGGDSSLKIDTVMAIYRRNKNGQWVEAACNDNVQASDDVVGSQLRLDVSTKKAYRIAVWGRPVNGNLDMNSLILHAREVLLPNGDFEINLEGNKRLPDGWRYLVDDTPASPPKNLLLCKAWRAYSGSCALALPGQAAHLVSLERNLSDEAISALGKCDKIRLSGYIQRRGLYGAYSLGWESHLTAQLQVTYGDGSNDYSNITVQRGNDQTYQEVASSVITLRGKPTQILVRLFTDKAAGRIFFDTIGVELAQFSPTSCTITSSPALVDLPQAPVPDLLRGN